jgi:hypothetical protein
MNTMDTYNKLMQIMNEKVLKNVNTAITGSRGKSTEKSMKVGVQSSGLNQSNSNKKLKSCASITHNQPPPSHFNGVSS